MLTILRISGVTGYDCETKITQGLLGIRGIDHVSLDVINSNLKLIYDKSEMKIEEIKAVLEDLGYPAVDNQ